jgi:hypothetical protein
MSLAGNLIIPIRESLVCDIPAGDGKIANLFYSVVILKKGVVEARVYEEIRELYSS